MNSLHAFSSISLQPPVGDTAVTHEDDLIQNAESGRNALLPDCTRARDDSVAASPS